MLKTSEMDDPLVQIYAPTDFEKLLFERTRVRELLKDIRKLSEELTQLKAEMDEIVNNQHSGWTTGQRQYIANMEKTIRQLRKENSALVTKVIQLQRNG